MEEGELAEGNQGKILMLRIVWFSICHSDDCMDKPLIVSTSWIKSILNLIQNSPAFKKSVRPPRMLRCEIQRGGQEMTAKARNKFNNDNSGEFGVES